MGTTNTTVGSPGSATASYSAGATPALMSGQLGELISSPLHGRWYEATKAGVVFNAAAVAAITIPLNAAALVGTFTLINPLGSNHVLELIDADFGSVSATEVVSDVSLAFQLTPGGVTGLSGLTAGTIRPMTFGTSGPASTSVCTYYTAATHTGTPTIIQPIFDVTATAVGIVSTHYDFDGKIIIYPGTILDFVCITAALTNAVAALRWAEWPV